MNAHRPALGVAVLAAAALIVTAGWAPAAPRAEVEAPPPELVEEGRRLYEAGCSTCHGVDGEGTSRGPSLQRSGAAGAHFYLSTGRMPLDEPDVQATRKPPAYRPEEIAALTAYVASLGDGPPIPDVDLATGELSEGSQLYAVNCAGCHNSAGSGGALGQAVFAPGVRQATPTQVAEAIRIGPGAMPVFGPDTLDDHQVASIIRYLEFLQRADDPGGAPLGRVGPVPEGLVAWLAGLGAMLLAAFWIGTRE